MVELTIENVIKLIIGALVVVAVAIAFGIIFKDKILFFFKNLPGNSSGLINFLVK